MNCEEKPVLQVKNLTVRYGKGCPQCQTHLEKNRCTVCGTVWAANDVSVEVYPGEVLGIVGESGSGKSTLMQSLYFDIAPTSGEAYLQDYKDGKESIWLASAAEQRHIKNCIMGMVYQNPVRGLRMQYSAASNLAEKLFAAGNRSAGHMTERAKELLQAVEILTSRMGEAPKNFSGGMQQRVQISKALANNPSLLLLDEVTTGLDLSVQAKVLDLIRQIKARYGISILLVSHDLAVIRMLADRTVVMLDGKIIESGLTDQILEDPQHAYTQQLVHSLLYGDTETMIAIENGKIVTPNGVITGKTLWLDNDRIAAIGACDSVPEKTINAHGRYILPGMIDVHSDKIEQFVFPRPTARFSFELALKECEKELLQLGITTIYHSFSLYSDELLGKSPLRTKESVLEMAELIADIQNRSHLIHHRFHLRLEIDNVDAFEIAKDMIQRHLIQEISFMDHTPGQGQYRDLEIYRETVDKYHGMENEGKTFEEVLEHHRNKKILSMEQLQELADLAHQNHITVASHDDDTVEKLQLNRQLGVDISEFPITEEVAKAAHEMGFYTIAGAPNILLGGSHSGNMSAAQAIQNQSVDILCSDYFPQALLHSLFVMCDKYGQTLPDMVNKVSLNPAKAMGIDKDYGSIEVGKKADLVIADILDGYPVVTHVLVDGQTTSRVEYRGHSI